MIRVETEFGIVELPVSLLRAIQEHGARSGEIMANMLDEYQRRIGEKPEFPPAFLLEWSAVMQLGIWELQGFYQHQAAGLPTYREACQELAQRASRGPEEFCHLKSAVLHRKVLQYWLEHFACQASEILGAEVAMNSLEEETFLEQVSDLLWKNRHRLPKSQNTINNTISVTL
ncbi:MAG: hypothetical protein JW829_21165 [Pirellulales bacterium]|nr:hypothetical protein [Pirellulales bacterium]